MTDPSHRDDRPLEDFVEVSEGSFYPRDQVDENGRPMPLPPEIGARIREIIEEDWETNPEGREIWLREAERKQKERKEAA